MLAIGALPYDPTTSQATGKGEKCIRVVNYCLLAPTHQVECTTMLPSNQCNEIFIKLIMHKYYQLGFQATLYSTSSLHHGSSLLK